MNLEVGALKDGGVLLVNKGDIPGVVKRIEFYRDQRLMTLVYQDTAINSDLFQYELPEDMIKTVDHSPDVMIYTLFDDHKPIGYKVPLIKIGELY